MSSVAGICKATQRHGNALVLLLLVKTWEGDVPPTRDELAELAHISPRQAERDLLKLVEDGEIEKVGRRGQITRFQIKGLSYVSDESDNQLTHMTDVQPSDVTDPAPVLTDMSVESAISDIPLSVSSVTSVRPFDGTEVAPLKAETTRKKKSQSTIETAGKSPAVVVDWAEISRERDVMLGELKSILGAVPNLGGERAACNWLLQNRKKLDATTMDFIECLREQAGDVREGNWRRKVSWMIVKNEFPSWQLRAQAKHNVNGGGHGKQPIRSGGRTTYNERANAALAEIYDLPRT